MSEQSMMIRLDHLEEMASNAADVHDVRELNAEICAIRARLSALESAQPAPAEAEPILFYGKPLKDASIELMLRFYEHTENLCHREIIVNEITRRTAAKDADDAR